MKRLIPHRHVYSNNNKAFCYNVTNTSLHYSKVLDKESDKANTRRWMVEHVLLSSYTVNIFYLQLQ